MDRDVGSNSVIADDGDVYIESYYDITGELGSNHRVFTSYATIILGGGRGDSNSIIPPASDASDDIYQRFLDAQNERGYVRTSTSNVDGPEYSTTNRAAAVRYHSNVFGNIVTDGLGNPWLDFFYVPADPIDDYEYNTMLGELMGIVEVGVSDVNNVSSVLDEAPEDFTRCPVCQETAEELEEAGSNVYRKTLCGHAFCDACLSSWLEKHKKCPVCMQDLQDIYDAATPPSSLVLLSDPEEDA
jgi:hypothetical protein